MNGIDVLTDLAQRPLDALAAVPELSVEEANAHRGGHPNSITWLLWHTGRMADMQLAQLSGEPELWAGYALSLPDEMGYGHSPEQARAVQVANAEELAGLHEYVSASLQAVGEYVARLDEASLDEVIDTSWTPHVTRGVRLVSILDDAAQHLGALNHVAHMPAE
ncbi:DinB family protein [Corynebacterium sp.]|uniref:DinB family protein n=1 Tax=Corynebacterium sp. TaxID=1720 RepID=UPI0026DCE2E7|nr:DinB family protein [Corynebacterium sp.]MDO5031180.1 DinB family protein [Corynebacterium sp.]